MVERISLRQPIADQMYEVLLHQFMSGERAAGESLNIGALSRELAVSQTPLREALARLEHTGLVEREALRGYRVAPAMTRDEVEQLKEARLQLEPTLAREAALRSTSEFVDALRETLDDFERSAEVADLETEGFDLYWRSDDRFHMLIAAQAGNKFLELAYAALGGQIQRFRLFSKFGRTGAQGAAPEHREIFDALAAGDADAADAAMRTHIAGAAERLLAR
ncbi:MULTISPECIES: GntR family transcriptional regulator [Leifsonia]|jgi:DNA-binding GntR family transcriptional regulator|uniref:FCD domain protein n=3 Tax=Leifsonia TaxID=110932 RepID=U2R5S2_LEIAQ|nr:MULTISPECIES: GntR family transcriptional regulator [Leifsonia]ERK70605.1 FCD domain protein [Leifsonia aquatica ATCC 14665]MBB2969341.1 DNA-binding GntR family transcriptional regulator [Leifsonia aquatica]NYK09442.1 DNA-binding GntR family transcriptional regulator [Leifsonia naganoensis]